MKAQHVYSYSRELEEISEAMIDFVSEFDDAPDGALGDPLTDDEQEQFDAVIERMEQMCSRYREFRRLEAV